MNKYFIDLNLDSILKIANRHLKTETALEKVKIPHFLSNWNKFCFEHSVLDEGINTMFKYGTFPVEKCYLVKPIVEYASKGGVLDLEMFKKIYVDLRTSIAVSDYFKLYLNSTKYLLEKFGHHVKLNVLKKAYDEVFDEAFEVKDTASEALHAIRKRIQKNEKALKSLIIDELRKYKDLLNDTTYHIRNGVFVLPVKTTFKNRVGGLIYDISDSGETTFIEPSRCLETSNEILKDTNLEKEEIFKIFKALTNETNIYKDQIISNSDIYAELDILNTKFLFLKEIDGNVIETKNDHHFNIINGRHPLIEKTRVIDNDIIINNKTNQLIISGPNAGGKSVFLKLAGVCVCLNQMIYPLPVHEKSTIGFFNKVYTDIGDLQSIEHNLSTFSAHISNIAEFLKIVKNNDLVLIDELGTGTDPKDGESLAIAICDYLNNTGCKSIITSHFDGVKEYSYTKDNIMCGSMIFDEKNMTPHYKLQIGIPGKSYGLLIAKKYGIKNTIIDDAQKYLNSKDFNNTDQYIKRLNKEIASVEKRKNEYDAKIKELEAKLADANKNNEVLQGKLKNFEKDTNEIRNEILQETREMIEEIKQKMLKNPNLKLHDLIKFEGDLKELEIIEEPKEEVIETFSIGDYIKDSFSGVEGKVVAVRKDRIDVIATSGKRYTLSFRETIKKIQKPKKVEKKKTNDFYLYAEPVKLELNLIGLHVDEALAELDYYLDKAILNNKEQVKIIHGFGTGALRNAVHEYLKKCKFVKSFKLGGQFDGGLGSTIVYLK